MIQTGDSNGGGGMGGVGEEIGTTVMEQLKKKFKERSRQTWVQGPAYQ